jgi:hypothetical protein
MHGFHMAICGLALASAAAAPAAIRLESAFIDVLGDGAGGGSDLGIGGYGDSFNFYDYSACDHHEEECMGLPYAGRRANGSWGVTLADNGISHRFDLFQGSDIGGPLGHEFFLEARFIADRAVRLRQRTGSGYSDFGCQGCYHYKDAAAFASQLPDGRWEIGFSAIMGAGLAAGGQSLWLDYALQISEVPETASWALLIAGFGLVGAAQRRRRYWAV